MRLKALLLCGFAIAMLSSTHMYASTLFNFSFTGNSSVTGIPGTPFSGSGQFTANQVGSTNQYEVVGVTGTTDGQVIGTLTAVGGYGFNDNLLFYSAGDPSAILDNGGVSYALVNGVNVNLYRSTFGTDAQQQFGFAGELIVENQFAPISIVPASTVPSVPEPSTFVLLGTGALGLIGTVRRRLAA